MATKSHELETGQDFAPDRTAQALLNLRCAVDHCHDAIFIADSTGKIEFINAAFEVLTGYTAQETKDGGLALIINGNPNKNNEGRSLADSSKALLEEVREKGIYRGTIRAIRKDGRRIELDLAMTLCVTIARAWPAWYARGVTSLTRVSCKPSSGTQEEWTQSGRLRVASPMTSTIC